MNMSYSKTEEKRMCAKCRTSRFHGASTGRDRERKGCSANDVSYWEISTCLAQSSI